MRLLLTLLLLVQTPGPATPAPPAESPAAAGQSTGETEERPAPVPVELETLRAELGPWLGREVTFVLQVDAEVQDWNPWLTRFSSRRYRGLRAWGDEVFLWDREAHSDPAPRLFVRRGTAADRVLRVNVRYRRYRVRAVVREVFLDEPWIELLEALPLSERVGEGTLLHAHRGLELLGEGHAILAGNDLERASVPRNLPEHVSAELTRLRALCDRSDGSEE